MVVGVSPSPLILATSSKAPEQLDAWGVFKKAAQRAGQGGLAGNIESMQFYLI
jgi:hypothetical protein